jgi:hypothetical protein
MQLKVNASINDTGSKLTTSVADTVANLQLVPMTQGVKIFPWICFDWDDAGSKLSPESTTSVVNKTTVTDCLHLKWQTL